MIIVNGNKFNNHKTNISLDKFSVSKYDGNKVIKRKSVAPYITFNVDDKIFVALEMNYSDSMFKEVKINEQVDITKFITDILYADEKGWVSLTTGKYACIITRKNEMNYNFDLIVEDKFEDISIKIDSSVKLFDD